MTPQRTRAGHRSHKAMRRYAAALATIMLSVVLLFTPSTDATAAPGGTAGEVTLKANLRFSGDGAPEETFNVVAKPIDGAPAPSNGSTQPCVLSAHQPNGAVEFRFSFASQGSYRYEVTEAAGGTRGVTYSTDAYQVEFEVFANASGTLDYHMHVVKVGDELAKPDSLSFLNTYVCPDCEPSGDPSGDPDACPECEPSGKPTSTPTPSGNPTDCPDCETGEDPSGNPADGPSGGSGDNQGMPGGGASGPNSGSGSGSGSGSSLTDTITGANSYVNKALSRTGAAVPVLGFLALTAGGSFIYLVAGGRRKLEDDGESEA